MKSSIHELQKKTIKNLVSKKIYTLYALLFLFSLDAQAQVPNSNFEQGLGYGLEQVASWGQFFAIYISIDMETGETTQDEIIFGDNTLGTFCLSTPEAHTGERALLVRNALNVTQNVVIRGKADLYNSEISDFPTGWNTGIPITEGTIIDKLGFHYKFFPQGNDVAQATLDLFGENGLVGSAVIDLSGVVSDYTYVSAPVNFISNDTPNYMRISFSMAAPDSVPTFGSWLVVDDVVVNSQMLHVGTNQSSLFKVYPTLVSDEINIMTNNPSVTGISDWAIIDATGRTIQKQTLDIAEDAVATIGAGNLSKGTYFLKSGKFITRFVKN